jgi:HPt (histidine-containing phosphotransfer) domain-containing protein
MTDPGQPAELTEALGRLWGQFLPKMRERVEVLEHAAQAVATGNLSADEQCAAAGAAHKLAGALGSFGLACGTELARELELMFSREDGPEPTAGPRLASLTAELRELIENRKQESQA